MPSNIWTKIERSPDILLRRMEDNNATDPKLPDTIPAVYVPQEDYDKAMQVAGLRNQLKPFDRQKDIEWFFGVEAVHGLLYLPYPYLVPGGRFNEMYGWDTAFPVFAWAEEHPRMMFEQIENQLYQVRKYEKVLNANRTYYLSRSQPPLIAAMTVHLYRLAQTKEWRHFDPENMYVDARDWLLHAYEDLKAYYAYWTTGDRRVAGLSLSRYWDESEAPAPEVVASEPGHFSHARAHFQENQDALQSAEGKNQESFYNPETGTLTPTYHQANRAMRASGFDPTEHWEYGGLNCFFHAPICLNALLYRMEEDLRSIADMLGKGDEVSLWGERKKNRKTVMKAHMFDEKTALYYDYNAESREKNIRAYATWFYPMWAGLYDDEDKDTISAAVQRALDALETPHGIMMSTQQSGSQWDAPYGWPPIQYFAMAALHRLGFKEDARRIAQKYMDLTQRVFDKHGSMFEKYNMIEGNADVKVVNGYHENVNEEGTFLWTAATIKMAYDYLETGVMPAAPENNQAAA